MSILPRMLLTIAAAATVSLPHVAKADGFVDRNRLLLFCSQSNRDACVGYVMGISDDSAMPSPRKGVNVHRTAGHVFCLPDRANSIQLADVVTKYLIDYPQWRHFAASEMVGDALAQAFPCPAN